MLPGEGEGGGGGECLARLTFSCHRSCDDMATAAVGAHCRGHTVDARSADHRWPTTGASRHTATLMREQ